MSTIGRQYKPQRSFINGVDNTTPLESPEITNTLSECINGEMVDNDIIKTRPGFIGITNINSNYIIREGIEYTKSDGTKEQIVYLESTTPTGTSGILGRINDPVIDNITTGLPDGIKPCMIQAGSLLFVFTGVSDFLYDGSVTRQIGIDAPTVEPQIRQLISGSLNDSGYYVFTYCYRNSKTGAISSPSLPSATIINGTSNSGIQVQVTPGSPTTADTIDIYRTVSGGTVYYYDGSTSITSTTYDSIIEDTGLGTELELDNSRLPEAAKFGILMDNRLFIGGFKSNPNRIQHSKIGINGTMFESFQIADIIDCNINDGDITLGLGKMGTKVGVLKSRRVGKLIPIEQALQGLEIGGSQKYIYKELSTECTGANHHSIFNIGGIMGWLGTDNIYASDSLDVRPIANRIRNTIRRLNHTQDYKCSSFEINHTQQVIISVIRPGQVESDYQLVLHYKDYPILGWTMFSSGINPNTHPGIPIGCIWEVTISGIKEIYFGSNNSNGKIYQYNVGTNDDNYPIYWSIKGQWETGPDAMGRKAFQSIKYLATTKAASPNNILTNTWEENGYEYVVKSETSTISTSNKWGTFKWKAKKWAGSKFTNVQFFPNRKAFLGRFGCYNDDLDAPFSIKSMRMLYRPLSE